MWRLWRLFETSAMVLRVCRAGAVWAIASLVMPAALVAELPAVDGKWRYFTSPHFELYSRNDEKSSRELLRNLELVRAIFLERLNLQERLRVDVTVYYFRTKAEFQAYAPDSLRKNDALAGFHLFRPDRAVISMAPAGDSGLAQQTVFHEYVHHLFRIAEYDPPLWFNEGTAEVLAGMKVERNRVLIGTPMADRALFLQQQTLLPLEQLFAADQASKAYADEAHTGVFYAQSWALLHYWYFGESRIPKQAVDRFIQVAGNREKAAAVDLRQHFVASFGFDYREMQRRLSGYIRTGRFRAGAHPMPDLAPASSYAMRAVPIDELVVRLAELSFRVERNAHAKLLLLEALEKRPQDARPLEVLGTDAYLEQDEAGAVEKWEQALAVGSTNAAVIRELALMEGRRWFEKFDETFQLPAARAARMRARLLRSIELEPHQAAAYEMLAWVEAFAAEPAVENVKRVIAQLPTMREKKRSLIALSFLMLRAGNPETAGPMLEHLGTLALSPGEAEALSALHAKMARDFPHAAGGGDVAEEAAEVLAPPPSTPGLKTPSLALPDDL